MSKYEYDTRPFKAFKEPLLWAVSVSWVDITHSFIICAYHVEALMFFIFGGARVIFFLWQGTVDKTVTNNIRVIFLQLCSSFFLIATLKECFFFLLFLQHGAVLNGFRLWQPDSCLCGQNATPYALLTCDVTFVACRLALC